MAGLGFKANGAQANTTDQSDLLIEEGDEKLEPWQLYGGKSKEPDGAFARGFKSAGNAAAISANLAINDAKGAAQAVADADRYTQENPSSKTAQELMGAWQNADESGSGWDNVKSAFSAVGDEVAKDWNESVGVKAKLGSAWGNVKAGGELLAEQVGNSVAPLAGTLVGTAAGAKAGAAGGGAIGAALGGVGAAPGAGIGGTIGGVAGGIVGASIGNSLQEVGFGAQDALQKAGIDAQDVAATEKYLAENRDKLLKQGAIKGTTIGVIDALTMRVAHGLLAGPAKKATNKALAELGVDVADKQAVKTAMQSADFKTLIANDAAYQATRTGVQKAARNVTAAALDPAGEFAGEYLGSGLGYDNWDAKDATLEAVMGLGQSGVMFAGQKAFELARRPQMGAGEDDSQQGGDMPSAPPDAPPLSPSPASPSPANDIGGIPISSAPNATQQSARARNAEPIDLTAAAQQADVTLSAGHTPLLPAPVEQTPAERAGVRAEHGPLSAAAALALNSGAARANALPAPENQAQAQSGGESSTAPMASAASLVAPTSSLEIQPQQEQAPNAQNDADAAMLAATFTNRVQARNALSKARDPSQYEVAGGKNGEPIRIVAKKGAQPASAIVLQNRDRSTPASINQMNEIAANPDYLRTGASRTMDQGAPVVFGGQAPASAVYGNAETVTDNTGKRSNMQYAVVEADDVIPSHRSDGAPIAEYANGAAGKFRVVAGNGRAAGLATAWNRGTAQQYRAELTADAARLGVDAAGIERMRRPMLVRIMNEADVTANIGDRSNIQAGSQLSPREQAANDARRIDFDSVQIGEDGEPQVDAVMRFISAMPTAEQGNLIGSDRLPTRQGIDRYLAAVFHQAYEHDGLTELYSQATDTESRTVIAALGQAAQAMARLKGSGEFDIRGAVAEAAVMAVNAKRRGIKLSQFVQNADFDMDPEAFVVAEFMARNIRSTKAIADGLIRWAALAERQLNIVQSEAVQVGMFGPSPTLSRRELFEELGKDDGQQRQADSALKSGVKPVIEGTERRGSGRSGAASGGTDGAVGKQAETSTDAGSREETKQVEATDGSAPKPQTEQTRAEKEAGAVTVKSDGPFKSKIDAGREMNKRGLNGSHELIKQAGGWVIKPKKPPAASADQNDPFSDEQNLLRSRRTKIGKTLDLMDDAQIEVLYERAGLAGAALPIQDKRAALKQEHPDDIEPLLAAPAQPQAERARAEGYGAGNKLVSLSLIHI